MSKNDHSGIDNEERRARIVEVLQTADGPTTGNQLSQQFGVTRQVIVADIAILRAKGENIMATPQGYVYHVAEQPQALQRKIAAHHSDDLQVIGEELQIIVDHGGKIVDVIVEHPLYGEITANLQVSSRYDVQQFVQQMSASKAEPLLVLTGGFHLHTVEAENEAAFERITQELRSHGYLAE